jgi:hypothetical protein
VVDAQAAPESGWRSQEAGRLTCHTGSVRDVVILGSTGSIGTQALQVVADQPGRFRVVALAAGGSDIPLLARQTLDTGAGLVAVSRSTAVQDLQLALYAEVSRRGWSSGEVRLPRIVSGPDAAREAATVPCDVVLNGITGAAGLAATLATLATGRILALANKESLVIGGPLVTRAAAPGQLVAVDSEHSALAQCLRGGAGNEVDRLVLTASGGPFRGRSREQMQEVTPVEALAHPTWAMGRVITTNSATWSTRASSCWRPTCSTASPWTASTWCAPAVDRPLDGPVRRRLDPGPVLAARHAAAHCPRAELAGAAAGRRAGLRLVDRRQLDLRAAGQRRFPRREAGRGTPAGSAAVPRRSTTRPTRSAWRPSTPSRSGS